MSICLQSAALSMFALPLCKVPYNAAAADPLMFPTESSLKVVENVCSISMDQVIHDCPHQNTQIFVSQKEIQ